MLKVFRPGRGGAGAALGPLETEIMNVLWTANQPCSVAEVLRELQAAGRDISYSAVKAVLNNLHGKGVLEKGQVGKSTFFQAVMDKASFEASIVTTVIRSLKKDFGAPVVAQLVDEFGSDEESLKRFERLIAIKRQKLRRDE